MKKHKEERLEGTKRKPQDYEASLEQFTRQIKWMTEEVA